MSRMGELTQEQIDAMLRGEEVKAAMPGDEADAMAAVKAQMESEEQSGSANDLSQGVAVARSADEDVREIKEPLADFMTAYEVDALGEISNICMGTSATTMSAILGRKVVITTPKVALFKPQNVLAAYRSPFLAISVGYEGGIVGKNLLVLKDYDAAVITDIMMGGEGVVDKNNVVLNEIHLSAISEIMNQMIGSSATAMSNMLGRSVNITPPYAVNMDVGADVSGLLEETELLIRISFDMEIENVLNSKLMQLMSLPLAKELVQSQLGNASAQQSAPAARPAPASAPAPAARPAPAAAHASAAPKSEEPKPMVSVKKADIASFDPPSVSPHGEAADGNLGLINDIPLQVTVELGRTHKSLQEVMNFGVGTIIMLDRLAGEAVDVIVNGKKIARGEVVVIDENYGVRISEIFSANSDAGDK